MSRFMRPLMRRAVLTQRWISSIPRIQGPSGPPPDLNPVEAGILYAGALVVMSSYAEFHHVRFVHDTKVFNADSADTEAPQDIVWALVS